MFKPHFTLTEANKNKALKIYFALFYFLSILMFLNFTWLRWLPPRLFMFFAVDLSGYRGGLEPSNYYNFGLNLLTHDAVKIIFLIFTATAALLFLNDKYVKVGSTLLLIAAHITGYAANGRIPAFDIMTYALTGYWAATCLAPLLFKNTSIETNWLRWLCTAGAIGITYASASISKLTVPEEFWANQWNTGLLMHVSRFRYETGLGFVHLPDWIVDFFSTPTHISTLVLMSILIFEMSAVFFILSKKYARLGMLILLLVHLGIVMVMNIVWWTVIVLLLILTFTKPPTTHESLLKERKFAGAFAALLLFISWAAPSIDSNQTFSTTSLVFPFNEFKMYSRPLDYTKQYYLGREDGSMISTYVLQRGALIGAAQVSLLVRMHIRTGKSETETAQMLCENIKARINNNPRPNELRNTPFAIWLRNIDVNYTNKIITSSNSRILSCN